MLQLIFRSNPGLMLAELFDEEEESEEFSKLMLPNYLFYCVYTKRKRILEMILADAELNKLIF